LVNTHPFDPPHLGKSAYPPDFLHRYNFISSVQALSLFFTIFKVESFTWGFRCPPPFRPAGGTPQRRRRPGRRRRPSRSTRRRAPSQSTHHCSRASPSSGSATPRGPPPPTGACRSEGPVRTPPLSRFRCKGLPLLYPESGFRAGELFSLFPAYKKFFLFSFSHFGQIQLEGFQMIPVTGRNPFPPPPRDRVPCWVAVLFIFWCAGPPIVLSLRYDPR